MDLDVCRSFKLTMITRECNKLTLDKIKPKKWTKRLSIKSKIRLIAVRHGRFWKITKKSLTIESKAVKIIISNQKTSIKR